MTTGDDSPRWTDPAALGAFRAALDSDGRPADPLLLVDLDGVPDPAVVAAAVRATGACDRVLVGVATRDPDPVLRPLVEALDLTLVPAGHDAHPARVGVPDPVVEAHAMHTAVSVAPRAAVVLAGLLRWSGALPATAALDAESLAYSTLLGGPEFRAWLEGRGSRPFPPPASRVPVRFERTGDVLHVTLDRPERRNAYGREVRDALVAAFQVAALDEGVARVVLDGAGPAFCAGGDLDEFGTTPDVVTAHLVRTRAGAARLFHGLADRVEVRLHGPCVGAGIELAAFANRVVADPSATFRLPELAMGLIPGAGGTVSIPRRISRWRTLHLALTGRPLDAATAHHWGLVDELR